MKALSMMLLVCLAAPLSAAAPVREPISERCQDCSECAGEIPEPRVVALKIYDQAAMSTVGLQRIVETANRIWRPYGVSVEPTTSQSAITVVVSRAVTATATDLRPAVLGDTLFTNGHATPYIHLWPANAEALATGAEIDGLPFIARSRVERDLILTQMLGVALAHELAHYLLDTSIHSTAGLLRGTLGVNDLAFPKPGHLRLTREQRQRMCIGRPLTQ